MSLFNFVVFRENETFKFFQIFQYLLDAIFYVVHLQGIVNPYSIGYFFESFLFRDHEVKFS